MTLCIEEEITSLKNRMEAVENQYADAEGPTGPQGIQGIQGIQGLTGPIGAPGLPAGQQWLTPAAYGNPLIGFSPAPGTSMRQRVIPPGFDPLGVYPLYVFEPGIAIPSKTPWDVFIDRADSGFFTGDVAYVAMAANGGNNGTGALNDPALPFLTVNHVLQSTTARIAIVEDGVFGPWDYRKNHQSGVPKAVIARNTGRVRVRVLAAAGDYADELTWTEDSGTWIATYTGTYGGEAVLNVVRFDLMTDEGFPLPAYAAGDEAECRATEHSFWVDTAAKDIYYTPESGFDVESNKGLLDILYFDSNATARCYVSGVRLFQMGFDFWGVQRVADTHTTTPGEIYTQNFRQLYDVGYGAHAITAGASVIHDDRGTVSCSGTDSYNINSTSTGMARIMLTRSWISAAGNTYRNGTGIFPNLQARSVHAGLALGIGNLYEGSFGQEIADTSTAAPSGKNLTWEAGSLARATRFSAAQDGGYGFFMQGVSNGSALNRKLLMDTCAATGLDLTSGLRLESYATAKLFNCPDLTVTAGLGSVAPGSYQPETPTF